MRATLKEKSWLSRRIFLETSQGNFYVEYDAGGKGYESVYVNGEIAARKPSYTVIEPEIEFKVAKYEALIEVSSTIWLSLRSFNLVVDGKLVYSEKKKPIWKF